MTDGLDPAVVTELLRDHLDPAASCRTLTRSASGNSQETWIVDVEGVTEPSRLVLRRRAPAGPSEWTDLATEVAALAAAAAGGVPVPAVRWWEADGGPLARPYVVMDVAPGSSPRLDDDAVRVALAADLGRRLAAIHRSPCPVELTRLDAGAELDRWIARARATGLAPDLLLALGGWLARRPPSSSGAEVLLWGDPGPHNVLADERGLVTAVLDWEMSAVGRPEADVGAARWSCLGHLDRETMQAAYELDAPHPLDGAAVRWFEVLACVSRSVMLLDGVRALLDGRSTDPNVAALGRAMVSANLVRGAVLAWDVDVAGAERRAADAVPAQLHPTTAERAAIVARLLTERAAPATEDRRLRRDLRIAAALLAGPDGEAGGAGGAVPRRQGRVDWFGVERTGALDTDGRLDLVAAMLAARRLDAALLDLYGATTAV
jgi:aminoglycoside phosphotransferase (APT) family kinase protein